MLEKRVFWHLYPMVPGYFCNFVAYLTDIYIALYGGGRIKDICVDDAKREKQGRLVS